MQSGPACAIFNQRVVSLESIPHATCGRQCLPQNIDSVNPTAVVDQFRAKLMVHVKDKQICCTLNALHNGKRNNTKLKERPLKMLDLNTATCHGGSKLSQRQCGTAQVCCAAQKSLPCTIMTGHFCSAAWLQKGAQPCYSPHKRMQVQQLTNDQGIPSVRVCSSLMTILIMPVLQAIVPMTHLRKSVSAKQKTTLELSCPWWANAAHCSEGANADNPRGTPSSAGAVIQCACCLSPSNNVQPYTAHGM